MATRNIYRAEVFHRGLNKYRIVRAASPYELDQKTRALMAQWDQQWARIVERENDADSATYAKELSQQAENMQVALDEILIKGSRANPNVSNKVITMLDRGVINAQKLVTHVFPLEEYTTALDVYLNRKDGAIKVVVKP